ncbi:MAG: tetratricopeptide repeat protein [Planctomycetota bacterium]|nr:tetratricopeptide repeat protein [Planctomycetota bacterium]
MSFRWNRFFRSLGLTLAIGLLVWGVMRFSGGLGEADQVEPAILVEATQKAITAVRARQPGDRRPASYDAILAPLDQLLEQAKNLLESLEYNPVGSYPELFNLTDPVIRLATEANQMAANETGPLAKEFRFQQQKAEACRYLATGMWNRLQANQSSQTSGAYASDTPTLAPAEVAAVLRVVNEGLAANLDNDHLYYLRAVVHRSNGSFPAAANDLRKALEINPENAEAWNVLGLVEIGLKDFDQAEADLEKAKAILLAEAKDSESQPGSAYISTLFNLARFHEGLSANYAREDRLNPTPENTALLNRHQAAARAYLKEFLEREPANSPDAKLAERLLSNLAD